MSSRLLVVLAIQLACRSDHGEAPRKQPPSTPPTDAAPPSPPPIVATTGPIELLPGDGLPLQALKVGELAKEYGNRSKVLVARSFPDGLSPQARAGINMVAKETNVSWVTDGDPRRGLWFAFDENANGDLRDDPRHELVRTKDGWEGSLTLSIPDPFSGVASETPARIRYHPDKGTYAVQQAIARKGTLALPAGPMQFAMLGSAGQFGLDHHYLAFDLDRDGKLALEALDNPELFGVFERTITIDDASYRFELRLDGSVLKLHPLATRLPPRPPLTTGTPAPDFTVTDLDGNRASLAGLRGKVVLVDFWSTGCGPCIKALPTLAKLRAQHSAAGFEVFSVADSTGDVAGTLGAHRTGIAAIDDAAHALYRIDRFPSYFLIARDGTIACSHCQLAALESKLASELAKPAP
jgi:thiol-disulfide isomerase/thioredoxin